MDRRLPKKLFAENGALTASDKRQLLDDVEEIQWVASIKPTTAGVPEYRDAARAYIEIQVVSIALRSEANIGRLVVLIHRSVPYPVFLIASHGGRVSISVAHKRTSHSQAEKVVIEGDMIDVDLGVADKVQCWESFLAALALPLRARINLFVLYESWAQALLALRAARITGSFSMSRDAEQAAARREALKKHAGLEERIIRLRKAAARERQLPRRVELNNELRKAVAELSAVRSQL